VGGRRVGWIPLRKIKAGKNHRQDERLLPSDKKIQRENKANEPYSPRKKNFLLLTSNPKKKRRQKTRRALKHPL